MNEQLKPASGMSDAEINELIAERTGLKGPFCQDLNAMHEAEKILKNHKKEWRFENGGSVGNIFLKYREKLNSLLGGYWGCAHEKEIFHATARQRAEAFVITLGKAN